MCIFCPKFGWKAGEGQHWNSIKKGKVNFVQIERRRIEVKLTWKSKRYIGNSPLLFYYLKWWTFIMVLSRVWMENCLLGCRWNAYRNHMGYIVIFHTWGGYSSLGQTSGGVSEIYPYRKRRKGTNYMNSRIVDPTASRHIPLPRFFSNWNLMSFSSLFFYSTFFWIHSATIEKEHYNRE